jgi:hypothetical protein
VHCLPGSFAEDKFDGTGTFKYGNGDLYMGGWKDGKKEGEGMYYFKVGAHVVVAAAGQQLTSNGVQSHLQRSDVKL